MASRSAMNVSLTPELERFVNGLVESGDYQTASEVVREGLRLLMDEQQRRAAAIEGLRSQIKAGIEQADRGAFVEGGEVFEEWRRRDASAKRGKRRSA